MPGMLLPRFGLPRLQPPDPAWTSVLALSIGIMFTAVIIQLPFLLFFSTLYDWVGQNDLAMLLSVLFQPAFSFAAPLFWLGGFFLGYPDRSSADWRLRFSLRRAVRGTALVALLATLFNNLSPIEPFSDFLELPAVVF